VEDEADAVAREITNLTKNGKNNQQITQSTNQLQYRDIAILVRANNHSEPFIRALSRHGIPHQFLGPGRLFRQSEIIDLISYLKVLYNFDDSVSLYRVLSLSYFKIAARDLIRIGNYARRGNSSFYEACLKVEDIFVSEDTKKKIKVLIRIIEKHLKSVMKETAGQLLYYYLEDTGLLKKLLSPDTPQAEKRAANVSKFFDKLKTYEVDHEDATVAAVVDWIELSQELGESPHAADMDWTEVNAVNLLTAHSAKGLESISDS
jgi:DNA helicase-2/ATP-dependent DNA helicase PcrA